MCIGQLTAFAQSTDYFPGNPPDPQAPVKRYTLKLDTSPRGAGWVSTNSDKYAEGEHVWLEAGDHNNHRFLCWKDDNGDTVSTDRWFEFDMPAKDLHYTAYFEYLPGNPGDPAQPRLMYNVTLTSKPRGAFSPNFGTQKFMQGEEIWIYCWDEHNYRFTHWEDINGDTISTEREFVYTVKAENVQFFACGEYNPSSPHNPGTNLWTEESGEVIIDYFNRGDAYYAVRDICRDQIENVTSVVVAGVINSGDYDLIDQLPNCSILDFSRTTGGENLEWYVAYEQNEHLSKLMLPACLNRIAWGALSGCINLQEITCYAILPPTVEGEALAGVPDNCVLYVPAESIELYANAEGWKRFTIMPIVSDVRALELNLPEECSDGRYKNMVIELVNQKSGQRYRYVVTDRINYIFSNLIKGTTYNAYLKNPSTGVVLSEIQDIAIERGSDNEGVSYTFADIKQLKTLAVSVLTPEGNDVTADCNVRWSTADGVVLSTNSQLDSQVEDTKVNLSVTLSQALGMKYYLLPDAEYVVKADDNDIVINLQAIPSMQLTGVVQDVQNAKAVKGAIITVVQTLNGKYSTATTAKTNNKGEFAVQVPAEQMSIILAATDYLPDTLTVATAELDGADKDLGVMTMKPVSGTLLTTNYTYTESTLASEPVRKANWYEGYNNVAYVIYNATQQKEVKNFSVQYPNIVLLDETNPGDVLEVTVKSLSDSFKPVVAQGTVTKDNTLVLSIDIVQLGGVKAQYKTSDNYRVIGMLYTADGALLKKAMYDEEAMSIQFAELPDGEYTLITMGESSLFNSFATLDNIKVTGLQDGVDYVSDKFTVKSGVISDINNPLVPFFDETKLYYTGNSTSFTSNKAKVVAGNYLTLQAKVDFKDVFASGVSNVKLIVELPASAQMVNNSVMIGSSLSKYDYADGRLSVSIPTNSERVRFCIIPSESGAYSPSAYVQFTLGGNTVTQPIGSAEYQVEALSFSIPEKTCKPDFNVNGVAQGGSKIEIYDGKMLIGRTTAYANGNWSAKCELVDPVNLTTHDIYAKVIGRDGVLVQTETKPVIYDVDALEVSVVHMYHWNPEMQKNYDMVFDYQNPTSIAQKYIYYIYNRQFSFTIDFTSNDPEKISNVILHVKTGDGNWTPLAATFDEKRKCWVANGEFGNMYDGIIPRNVSVEYRLKNTLKFESTTSILDDSADPELPNGIICESDEDATDDLLYAISTISDALQIGLKSKVTYEDEDPEGQTIYSIDGEATAQFSLVGNVINLYITSTFLHKLKELPISEEIGKVLGDAISANGHKWTHIAITIDDANHLIIGSGTESALYQLYREAQQKYSRLESLRKRIVSNRCLTIIQRNAIEEKIDKVYQHYFTLHACGILLSMRKGGQNKFIAPQLIYFANLYFHQYYFDILESIYLVENTCTIHVEPVPSPCPDLDPAIDPSGFVYEAVTTNRLQGVKATVYYKEMTEDIYGDKHEDIVLWNAEEYAQENPLFTDEQGMYRWDVPEGLWQVKFEKEGYETAYSEWLPVPPPQLDINIAMTQKAQPELLSAVAYEVQAARSVVPQYRIEVQFSKYMDPSTLTTDNIKLRYEGTDNYIGDLNIEFIDETAVSEDNPETYVSLIAINTDTDLSTVGGVELVLSSAIKSYAGVECITTTQKLDIEQKIVSLTASNTNINVGNGQDYELMISAQPAEASKGRKVVITSASDMIASVATTDDIMLDDNGQATFTIHGNMIGNTALTVKVVGDVDSDVKIQSQLQTSVVDPVKLEPVKEVTASIFGDDIVRVYRGQTVTLACATEGATIYYTTNGDEPTVQSAKFTKTPIRIDDEVTVKAFSVGVDGKTSEVKTFCYGIRQATGSLNFHNGWNWASHSQASGMSKDALQQNGIMRVQTQTSEMIYDPAWQMYVGSLDDVEAGQAIKVQTDAETSVQLGGDLYNPSTNAISLASGWNWLGYPLDQTQTLGSALALLDAETDDFIVGKDGGYATYDGNQWVGSLTTLEPGQGYLYKSVNAKAFIYDNSTVSKAKALNSPRLEVSPAPWVADSHRYPNVMCITAELCDLDGIALDADDYHVAAFAGDECRGVAKSVNGTYFLSVYGDKSVPLSFKAVNIQSGDMYDLSQKLSFNADVMGTVQNPFKLYLDMDATGIHTSAMPTSIHEIYTVDGVKVNKASRPGIYIKKGVDAEGKIQMMKQYIK